jgi:hypothetical protein
MTKSSWSFHGIRKTLHHEDTRTDWSYQGSVLGFDHGQKNKQLPSLRSGKG